MPEKFQRFFERNELGDLIFSECKTCQGTVVISRVKAMQREVYLEPKPVSGSEVNPVYDRHVCPTED